MTEHDDELDVSGMCCPMPLIRIAERVGGMRAGQVLRIMGDDPVFEQGVRDYCEVNQIEILSVTPQSGRLIEITVKTNHQS